MSAKGEESYRQRCIDKLGVDFRGCERLLDAGCGNGSVARMLSAHVREVVAVDVEHSAEWSEDGGVSFSVADVAALPFEDDSFDVVHSKDALHHMRDPVRALWEFRRVLRPGGTVMLVEGNRFNPVFYPHLTLLLGHEHFTRQTFRRMVTKVFPEVRFGGFEAHYAPIPDRLVAVQRLIEETMERLPPLRPILSYNFAVATPTMP